MVPKEPLPRTPSKKGEWGGFFILQLHIYKIEWQRFYSPSAGASELLAHRYCYAGKVMTQS